MLEKKEAKEPKCLRIAQVAHETTMYSQELEERLNNEIEQPFNAILDRIDKGGTIEPHDLKVIAHYALTMIRRVPSGRSHSVEVVPEVTERVEKAHLARIGLLEQLAPDEAELAAKGRENVSQIFEKLRSEDPDWLWHGTVLPENFPLLAPTLQQMTWAQWHAPAGRQLFIGDNPLLFDREMGLGHERAEIVLPIRSDMALVANWRPGSHGRVRELSVPKTRQINTKTVMQATRWIFFKDHERWVQPFVRKHLR